MTQNKEHIILIDSGGNRNSSGKIANSISTYLKSLGISRINYFVITHGDYDHMGEAINLVNNFKATDLL